MKSFRVEVELVVDALDFDDASHNVMNAFAIWNRAQGNAHKSQRIEVESIHVRREKK
jgi:hypothetical protein